MTRAVVRWVVVAAVAQGLAGWAAVSAQGAPPAAQRLAYVRSGEILRKTPGYAAAESTFTRELRAAQLEMERFQARLDTAMLTFEQQSIALSPPARQAKQRELTELQRRYQQRATELQEKARQRERDLMGPIQARVNSVIQGIRAEGNYALIFDAEAPNAGIVAADPALDLTARVIERLRQAP